VKAGLFVWVLLSAAALAGGAPMSRIGLDAKESQFESLAARHNLLVRLDPSRAHLLERVLRAARQTEGLGGQKSEGEAARELLKDPHLRALSEQEGPIDPAEAERLLENPEIRGLVEKLKDRTEPAR
jgi:hypothetical protein